VARNKPVGGKKEKEKSKSPLPRIRRYRGRERNGRLGLEAESGLSMAKRRGTTGRYDLNEDAHGRMRLQKFKPFHLTCPIPKNSRRKKRKKNVRSFLGKEMGGSKATRGRGSVAKAVGTSPH